MRFPKNAGRHGRQRPCPLSRRTADDAAVTVVVEPSSLLHGHDGGYAVRLGNDWANVVVVAVQWMGNQRIRNWTLCFPRKMLLRNQQQQSLSNQCVAADDVGVVVMANDRDRHGATFVSEIHPHFAEGRKMMMMRRRQSLLPLL